MLGARMRLERTFHDSTKCQTTGKPHLIYRLEQKKVTVLLSTSQVLTSITLFQPGTIFYTTLYVHTQRNIVCCHVIHSIDITFYSFCTRRNALPCPLP